MAKVMLKGVRLSFPQLFIAKEFKAGDGKPRYTGNFLVEPGSENDKLIRAAIQEAADDKWGKKAAAELKAAEHNPNRYCYQDGNIKEYDGYADMMFLTANRAAKNGPPKVLNRDKSPLTVESGKPYSGCYVNASVDVYVQPTGEFKGVRCELIGVQFVRDGEAFAGSPATDEDFDELGDDEDLSSSGEDDPNKMWQ